MELTPTLIQRESARRLRRMKSMTGEDIRRLRLDANVSATALARAIGIDPSHFCRIEAGTANPSLEVLVAIGVALGADLGVRYFAGPGPRIHDRFSAPMLEALLRDLHPRWRPELEVAVRAPSHGVIDAVLRDSDASTTVATEVQSELRRLEQQIRWGREKAEALATLHAGRAVSQLLLLRSTRATRELARTYGQTLRTAFPARSADAYAVLATGEGAWPGAAIVWVHVHGRTATLMAHPPRGVAVGR